MKQTELYELFNTSVEAVKHSRLSPCEKQLMMKGVRQTLLYGLSMLDTEDIPTMQRLTPKQAKSLTEDENFPAIGTIKVFDDDVTVYEDDNGQCFCVKYKGDLCGLGTYNICIEQDVLFLHLSELIDNVLLELGEENPPETKQELLKAAKYYVNQNKASSAILFLKQALLKDVATEEGLDFVKHTVLSACEYGGFSNDS